MTGLADRPRELGPGTLKGQTLRFLVGGAANTLVSYVIYWLLLLVVPYAVAYTASYVATVFSGFWINTRFVFRAPWSWSKLFVFPLVHVANYSIGLLVIWVSVSILGINPWVAPVIATIVALPFNFLLTRLLMQWRTRDG